MNSSHLLQRHIKAYFFIVLFIFGCTKQEEAVTIHKLAIPVTVLKVESNRLRGKVRLTGSVLPWKKETLRFEIAGKLSQMRVTTPGKNMRGELKDEFGKMLYKGQVVGVLDSGPYELALQEAEAQMSIVTIKQEACKYAKDVASKAIEVAKARVEVSEHEIALIFPLDIQVANENYKLAEIFHLNTEKAYQQEDASHSKRAEARTNMLNADAMRKKLEIQRELKQKELQTYKAELFRAQMELKLREAEEKTAEAEAKSALAMLKRARQNIEKCTLRVPFDGVISEILINPGSMVDPSVPIATLVMMDPVRVDMAVSFKKIRDFHFGNEVRVLPPRESIPFEKGSLYERGFIYHIHTTADPSTRTFLAIIAVRNRQFNLDTEFLASHREFREYQTIADFSGLVHRNPDSSGSLYVDVRCIQRDDKGTFVWKVAKKPDYHFNPEATLSKVYINLGDDHINVITWLFREIKPPVDLKDDDILLLRPSLLRMSHLKKPKDLALKLKEGKDPVSQKPHPVSQYIKELFSPYAKQILDNYNGKTEPDATLQRVLMDELNHILEGELIYQQNVFGTLSQELLDLVSYSPKGEELIHLNRLLLQTAYKEEIVQSYAEFEAGQKILQLRQDWLFHPGELVEVEYDRELPEAIYLPSEAILKSRYSKEEIYYVFVVKDTRITDDGHEEGMAERRMISKSPAEDLWSIKNLNEGERVVIHGSYSVNNRYESLKDDIPVRINKEEKNLSELVKDYEIVSKSQAAK